MGITVGKNGIEIRLYSPGPWKMKDDGDQIHISAYDGYDVTAFSTADSPEAHPRIDRANARLASASPLLLEAAQEALKKLRGSGHSESTKAVVLIRAAIEQATGERP